MFEYFTNKINNEHNLLWVYIKLFGLLINLYDIIFVLICSKNTIIFANRLLIFNFNTFFSDNKF